MNNRLRIEITTSLESNDHQARIFIDEVDWLGPAQLGLDPPDLASELSAKSQGRLRVGRCDCGVVGCSDVFLEAVKTREGVEWGTPGAVRFNFNVEQFDAEVSRFLHDQSWETIGRAIERELGVLFKNTATEDGLAFQWASTRIQDNLVHLSFMRNSEQRLLKFSWDGVTLASALDRAGAFYRERFDNLNGRHPRL